MNLGGPVWHASAATLVRLFNPKAALESLAQEAIANIGDSRLGEWREWTGKAFHIRRRLSVYEQELVGEVKDIRGTPEAVERLNRVRKWLPPGYTE